MLIWQTSVKNRRKKKNLKIVNLMCLVKKKFRCHCSAFEIYNSENQHLISQNFQKNLNLKQNFFFTNRQWTFRRPADQRGQYSVYMNISSMSPVELPWNVNSENAFSQWVRKLYSARINTLCNERSTILYSLSRYKWSTCRRIKKENILHNNQ